MAAIDVLGLKPVGVFLSGNYLSAQDTTATQSITAPYEIKNLQFGTTLLSNGISITGVNNTDITFANPGIYNIQFSVQVTCNTPQAHLFYLWLCVNGSPVANSNSVTTVHGTHGGNNGHLILSLNFVLVATAGMKAQLCWSANNIAIEVETIPSPAVGIPVSPGVILSVTQI